MIGPPKGASEAASTRDPTPHKLAGRFREGHGLVYCLGKRVVASGLERGLLLNAIQGKILRFTPPLILEEGHVDEVIEKLDEILAAV